MCFLKSFTTTLLDLVILPTLYTDRLLFGFFHHKGIALFFCFNLILVFNIYMIPKSKLWTKMLCPLPYLLSPFHRLTIFINFQIILPFLFKRKIASNMNLPESIRICSVKQNHYKWYRGFIVWIRHATLEVGLRSL